MMVATIIVNIVYRPACMQSKKDLYIAVLSSTHASCLNAQKHTAEGLNVQQLVGRNGSLFMLGKHSFSSIVARLCNRLHAS